jgi:hypothetical protein
VTRPRMRLSCTGADPIDRYGPAHDLPAVYSGHNVLHAYGPPPEPAVVVSVCRDRRVPWTAAWPTFKPLS